MDTVQNSPRKERQRLPWYKRFARISLLIILLVLAFLIYWFFFNKYADGERTGVLVKVSHKGNIWKTDEGEMWLSCRQVTNPEKFYFSVANDSVMNVMRSLQDECVQLSYYQYRATLPWRGKTRYIVTRVVPITRPIDNRN